MQVIVISICFCHHSIVDFLKRYGHEMDEDAYDSRFVKNVEAYTAFFGTELEIEVSKCRQCCEIG